MTSLAKHSGTRVEGPPLFSDHFFLKHFHLYFHVNEHEALHPIFIPLPLKHFHSYFHVNEPIIRDHRHFRSFSLKHFHSSLHVNKDPIYQDVSDLHWSYNKKRGREGGYLPYNRQAGRSSPNIVSVL